MLPNAWVTSYTGLSSTCLIIPTSSLFISPQPFSFLPTTGTTGQLVSLSSSEEVNGQVSWESTSVQLLPLQPHDQIKFDDLSPPQMCKQTPHWQ